MGRFEKIVNARGSLEGERKHVTVLFADMKGSMELLADRDPEEARAILDPILERMMEPVRRYEGTVNQVMGDGIMALFGAPLAHEDHAVRACYAALRMHEIVERYAVELRQTKGIDVQIRIGINSGEVVVRSIGSDFRVDYTAVGQTTHLAARLEQLARPGTTLITGDTLRLVEGYVQLKSLGPTPVKGLSEPVALYELTGASAARTRFQAQAARGRTRFVGREAEIEHLERALAKAGQGQGQIVAVVGEPGVGKSRIFYEVVHSHRMRDWLVLESGSVSYVNVTSYLPVIDLLKAYFRIHDGDDHLAIREKVAGKLLTLDRALEPMLPAVLALLDVATDLQWQRLDPPQRRKQILEAIKRLLLRESQVQPLCLVFEDLHGIDSETQALLDSLVMELPTARVLLLVNYRPEYQQEWESKTHFMQLRIEPLPPDNAEELLHAMLGDAPTLQPLKQLLVEQTEGNPFFLEESVRTLIETGALIGERGAYRLTKNVTAVQVAPTVRAVLAARIDRLPADEKHLLQSAAVIGKDVPLELLQVVADLPDEDLRRGLMKLQSAELLFGTSSFSELEFTFKHALTHEVAYGDLLQERRRALHARIVEGLERLHPDRLTEHVERLAHHAFRGHVWNKAVVYLRQAGAKAAARSANREAVACFEQALVAVGHLPQTPDALQQAIDLRFDLRSSLLPLGEFERILTYLREAETLTEALGDPRRLGRLTVHLTTYVSLMGDQTRALEYGERALGLASTLRDFALEVETKIRLGQIYSTQGNYRRAIDILAQSLESLKGDLLHERFGLAVILSIICRNWLLRSFAEVGNFAQGIVCGEEGIRMAERVGQPIDVVVASHGLGLLYLRQGDLPPAIALLERGLEFCRAWNIRVWFPLVASALGYAYALSGRPGAALTLLEQALEQHASIGRLGGHALRVGWLAEAHLRAGRLERAVEVAARALELSRIHAEQGHEAWALWLSGDIASRRDPPDWATADDYYRQALRLAEALAMRPLTARCHLGLGRVCRAKADSQKASEHLTAANVLFHEMNMPRGVEQGNADPPDAS